MSVTSTGKYNAAEWDYIRERFTDSALKETELAILAQNAGFAWPFKGAGETPEKYIQYDFEDLQTVPGLVGKKKRVEKLMDILTETLAFDDPFSDLAHSLEAESEEDHTFQRILTKFSIDHDYPVELLHFDAAVQALIEREGIRTLIELVYFGQKTAPSDLESKDLKDFLNGLAHKDEVSIAKHIPFRPVVGGLHFVEAIGLIAETLSREAQVYLLSQTGTQLRTWEETIFEQVDADAVAADLKTASRKVLAAKAWFKQEAEELEQTFRVQGAPERLFIALNDSDRERLGLALAKHALGYLEDKKSGLLGKFFGR
ncbi:MAG: hypothetical protein EA353_11415 [Puniceicoccaceae bacterium]|nr:MAG: hypothetical protein EA353_11415 [Puniceicoccaceae bacterium]